MKISKVLFAAALLSLGIVSCQKDENVITHFTAGIEQSSAKMYLDGTLLKWSASGDEVKVYGTSGGGAIFSVTPREDNATWADLDYVSGGLSSGPYTAIYPASIATSASSVTLPVMQTSLDGSLTEFPMYAESSTDVFQFQNLCGAVRIHLESANCTISRIKITASGGCISGTYPINVDGGVPVLGTCTNGSNIATLSLTNAQDISTAAHDFYIYLPAGTYEGMQITFYQPDGSYCTKNGTVTIERSVCSPIIINGNLEFETIPNLLNGFFTINAQGGQVRFASGNLQYVDGAWRFADHQYDVLDVYSATAWDRFGWSTNATDYGMSTATTNYSYRGDFVDWGTAINPGGVATPWRTLSKDEWSYLLGSNVQRAEKYGLVTITDRFLYEGFLLGSIPMCGLVLLPDGWTACPAGITFTAGYGSGYRTNEYTSAQWAQMEAAGAVFLPAAGGRDGSDISLVGFGYYWSSTNCDTYNAYSLYITESNVTPNYGYNRYFGRAVRLVQDSD